jgi:hypothetical protein
MVKNNGRKDGKAKQQPQRRKVKNKKAKTVAAKDEGKHRRQCVLWSDGEETDEPKDDDDDDGEKSKGQDEKAKKAKTTHLG